MRSGPQSYRRLSSWLVVAGTLVVYAGLVGALGLFGVSLELPLPSWATQAIAPLLYAALVVLVARPRSPQVIGGGVALLWGAHLIVGALTLGALAVLEGRPIMEEATTFPPPLLPSVLWVPTLLVPLKDWLRGRSRPAVRPMPAPSRRPAGEHRAPAPAPQPPAATHPSAPPTSPRPATIPPRPTAPTLVTPMAARFEPARGAAPSGPAVAPAPAGEPPAPVVSTDKPAKDARDAAAVHAQRLLDDLLGRETSDHPVRVTFDRIKSQLPAEGFARPVDDLAAEISTPGVLLVPRRPVLTQLADGLVRIDWDVVASQFPSHLIATSHEAIKATLPDGQLVLPLDELVRQFSPEIFLLSGPGPDIRGIEVFPAPFQPIDALGDVTASQDAGERSDAGDQAPSARDDEALANVDSGLAAVVPAGSDAEAGEPVAARRATPDGALDDEPSLRDLAPVQTASDGAQLASASVEETITRWDEPLTRSHAGPAVDASFTEDTPRVEVALEEARYEATPRDEAHREAAHVEVAQLEQSSLDEGALAETLADTRPVSARVEEGIAVASLGLSDRVSPEADPLPAIVRFEDVESSRDDEERVASGMPREMVAATAAASRVSESGPPSRDDVSALRELVALLPPIGPLEMGIHTVHGVTVFAAASPELGDDLAAKAAGLVLPALAHGRAVWPIEQVTLRGPRAALVLTPLGPLVAGGPVFAAAVHPGGTLALTELRCRQAAAEYAAREGRSAAPGAEPFDEREEPDLLDVEPSTRIREIAASLGALGAVTASTLRDADGDRAFYLFLPPGSDVRAMGAIANDLSRALRRSAEGHAVFRTALLRSGARRMVVRLPATLSGRSDTIVAAGETARPGLAYRQIEHAAVALGAP